MDKQKIIQLWPFLAWLDYVWFHPISPQVAFEGPVFARLSPSNQVLVHWLCYICDRRQDATKLWPLGGRVFSSLVQEYSSGSDVLDLLKNVVSKEPSAKAFRYKAADQPQDGEAISFTPRLPAIVPIASTLLVLEPYERSPLVYISNHWNFCQQGDVAEIMHRIAFLFHILSYWNPGPKRDPDDYMPPAKKRADEVAETLSDKDELETLYGKWRKQCYSNNKRVWAALRDWIAPGSPLQRAFLNGMGSTGKPEVGGFIRSNVEELLKGLEVPGDVWNARFLQKIFDPKVGSQAIREWYEQLNASRELPPTCWPSQFDVSFIYSPQMCAKQRQDSCLFRRESRAWKLCPVRDGYNWKGRPCPLVDHLCDFEYACEPEICPVPQANPSDICPGCERKIIEVDG